MGKKIWMIVAASLILAGSFIFVGVMSVLKWDFTKLSTTKYAEKTYEITEDFANISIIADTADITFVATDAETVQVFCREEVKMPYVVSVKDGTLDIRYENHKKWYHYISIFNFGGPKLTVYLPKGDYGSLTVHSDTGDLQAPGDLSFTNMNITTSTGDVHSSASVSGAVNIKTSTGDIYAENIAANSLSVTVSTGDVTLKNTHCTGKLHIGVSTGDSFLHNVQCGSLSSTGDTGDMKLQNVIATADFNIKRSTGDITFTRCDATELTVATSTGDVTGSLCSPKVFIPSTSTGNIHVPESTSGGKCKITTSTGNIKIQIV